MDPTPPDPAGDDQTLVDIDIEGLAPSDAAWVQHRFLDFHFTLPRFNGDGFFKFPVVFEDHDLRSFLTQPLSVY